MPCLFQENKLYSVEPICIHPLMLITVRRKSHWAQLLLQPPPPLPSLLGLRGDQAGLLVDSWPTAPGSPCLSLPGGRGQANRLAGIQQHTFFTLPASPPLQGGPPPGPAMLNPGCTSVSNHLHLQPQPSITKDEFLGLYEWCGLWARVVNHYTEKN